jgi:hypothetical protein
MYEVELDVFSGRPNPRWVLTPAESRQLTGRVRDGTAPVVPVSMDAGNLGYRGFIVRASGTEAVNLGSDGRPIAFRVRSGLAPARQFDLAAEEFLLTGLDRATDLSDDDRDAVSERAAWDMEQQASRVQGELLAAGTCSLYYTSWQSVLHQLERLLVLERHTETR